jgi:hypothetical protein
MVEFGRRGEGVSFDRICRFEITQLPAPGVIVDSLISSGGHTCHLGDRGILFVPERAGQCVGPPDTILSRPSIVSQRQAEAEVQRCSAIARPSSSEPVEAVVFRPSGDGPDAEDRFLQFGLDAGALVTHDMLPVSHFGFSNLMVCMEARNAREVLERVRQADIADPADLLAETYRSSCRELAPILTGHEWPEVVPDAR